LLKLIETADVFLVSLLPDTRRKMGIDVSDILAVNPRIIYATGSGLGPRGRESNRGGYDGMTFWARGGVAAAVTPAQMSNPTGMPVGAFGDALTGAILAGGISAALALRERTGEVTTVDVSLLASAMWGMQAGITGSSLIEAESLPPMTREASGNPLVGSYRTKDGRHVALNMMQADRYWPDFCQVIGRPDLIDHPKFGSAEARASNIGECLEVLDGIFVSKTLAEWRELLGRQPGQWDVLKKMGELREDPQAVANGYVERLDYGDNRRLDVVTAPIQFGRSPGSIRPAPEFGADTDAVLKELGMNDDEIIQAKIDGVVA
jgi:crotonobetainyl-CoA:carnitine CoA-transferase CaiB-like acyl-CoA transferase